MNAVVQMKPSSKDQVGYVDDLFGIPVPKEARDKACFPMRTRGPDTPPVLPYKFRRQHIKIAQLWFSGMEKFRNLMLTGPTGSGKTSLVEQLAARLGWEVIRVGCSGSLEFQELIGRITLNRDGSTGWQDGPVVVAMKKGAILLLDEINFLHPNVVGGLNTILDGGTFLIPETGERVIPAASFRIAATGNALNGDNASNYRGIQRMNDALLDRFRIGIEVEYMTPEEEAKLLVDEVPSIDKDVIGVLISVAEAVRKSFNAGDIQVTLSTRVLLAWCEVLSTMAKDLKQQLRELANAFEIAYGYRIGKADKESILNSLNGIVQRMQK